MLIIAYITPPPKCPILTYAVPVQGSAGPARLSPPLFRASTGQCRTGSAFTTLFCSWLPSEIPAFACLFLRPGRIWVMETKQCEGCECTVFLNPCREARQLSVCKGLHTTSFYMWYIVVKKFDLCHVSSVVSLLGMRFVGEQVGKWDWALGVWREEEATVQLPILPLQNMQGGGGGAEGWERRGKKVDWYAYRMHISAQVIWQTESGGRGEGGENK